MVYQHGASRMLAMGNAAQNGGVTQDAIPVPSRPLTRVIARARSLSRGEAAANSQNNSCSQQDSLSLNDKGDLTEQKRSYRAVDAYLMEVNEYICRPDQLARMSLCVDELESLGNGKAKATTQSAAIPCVTVRDLSLMSVAGQKKRIWRRVWIPVALSGQLVRVLKASMVSDEDSTSQEEKEEKISKEQFDEDSVASTAPHKRGDQRYDVSRLEGQTLICPATKRVVEIGIVPPKKLSEEEENVGDKNQEEDGNIFKMDMFSEKQVYLRTYMDASSKEDYKAGDCVEIIVLRDKLMGRLIKFLDDVVMRYRRISEQMIIPSLYSYSGQRRFYFDLRETRWGMRLHISQVTERHRNVIGIPLEELTSFRDRLNQAIKFLSLNKPNQAVGGLGLLEDRNISHKLQSNGRHSKSSNNRRRTSTRAGADRTGSGNRRDKTAIADGVEKTDPAQVVKKVPAEPGSGSDIILGTSKAVDEEVKGIKAKPGDAEENDLLSLESDHFEEARDEDDDST